MASSSSQLLNILDDTRVHPESYTLAQELVKCIYSENVEDSGLVEEEDMLEMAIDHIKPNLKSLNIDEYAKSKNHENKTETLSDIRVELIHGFQDRRKPYVEASQDEEFFLISGENEDTLVEGRIVQATIRRVQAERAICSLECGLTGMLCTEDYTSNGSEVEDLTEKLKEGDVLTCRIKSVVKDRFQVFLNCKESDMKSNRYQSYREMDPYYREDRSSLQRDEEKARKEKELAKKNFKPRLIVHPRFQNITADEAVEVCFFTSYSLYIYFVYK